MAQGALVMVGVAAFVMREQLGAMTWLFALVPLAGILVSLFWLTGPAAEEEAEEALLLADRNQDDAHVIAHRGNLDRDLGREFLPELARVPACVLGRGQGHVRRPVTVVAVRRPFDPDRLGQRVDLERDERRP